MFWRTLLTVTVLLGTTYLQAQEPIRFARTPDISPDGKLVAFSYLGDIWTVEAIGGIARPVTMHEAHDAYPVFSPDGRSIAFSSNRHGSYDVFVVSTQGGKPKRLTFDSGEDVVCGWSPDGKSILFRSTRNTTFPNGPEVYSVPMEGRRETKLPFRDAKEVSCSPDGKMIAFVRGPGLWYRKGYRGSSNDDLWLAHADGSNVRRLTDFNGQDAAPMWGADGRRLFYVSEVFGNPANIVVQDLTSGFTPPLLESKPRLLTHHQEDGVRRARINASGDWIVYECGFDLWIAGTKDGSTRKLAIEVNADEKSNPERITTYTKDVTEYALSPDEGHMAIVIHGEIFLIPSRGGKATQMTHTAAVEHNIAWAPNGKSLLFAADRNGQEDLFLLEPDDPDHPEMTKAHRFKAKQLTKTTETESGASFSPDGSRIAFLRSGLLYTMRPDGSDSKVIVDVPQVFDYDWSPDSKNFVIARSDGSYASELYIVPSDGSDSPKNITRYATYNGDVTWSQTGNKIGFLSQRRGSTSMHVLDLQKSATTGSSSTNEIDWEDIHLRVNRPSSMSANEGAIARNGRMIAFSAFNGGDDLWICSVDGMGLNRVTTGNTRPRAIRWSKSSGTVFFLDGSGSIRNVSLSMLGLGGGPPPAANTINFTAKLTINRDEEYQQMFEQCGRSLADHFYDSQHHGLDWKIVRDKYRPLLSHVTMKEDLYSLISLMLGELNASHLGISGPGRAPEEVTADLGLIFDPSYKGPGLKIAEILKRGPADKRGLKIQAGDVLLAVDRQDITDKTNLAKLLNGKVNEVVLLDLTNNPSDLKPLRRRIEIQATGREQINQLMYQRWVDKNAAEVSKQSKGTLGYIHIPSMDEQGLEQFVRSLYSDNFDKEAIVLDVRYNGGGFTHDQVLNYLGAKPHTIFRQRDGGEGLVMRSYDRKWTKPLILLINNRSYSDAEIFPNAFRTLGLGKIVGQPTGGFVIGTGSTRLIDGSTFRLPRTGVWTVRGINMEKEGVIPDVTVEASPEDLAKGIDAQLTKAVELLQKDVIVWKKANPPVFGTSISGSSPVPGSGK